MMKIVYNHKTSKLSTIDIEMIRHIPAGGNWKNIPEYIPSKRLQQIRVSGGRTTYYGRLKYDKPSYTISTYFNRPGNGCYIHPADGSDGNIKQDRLISFREAARLQSFPDDFRFFGSNRAILKQIGNAVPPLLAKAIADGIYEETVIDLFSGAGGLSLGFKLSGKKILAAIEIDKDSCESYRQYFMDHSDNLIEGDIKTDAIKNELYNKVHSQLKGQHPGIIIGGPPCQGFSLAGNRFIDDPRNELFKDFVEIVRILEPNVFLMENVPGLLTAKNKSAIIEIVNHFRKLSYQVYDPVMLKAEEYGVPQFRRRLFILGCKKNTVLNFPPPTLFGNEPSLFAKPKPVITVREAISDLPPILEDLGSDEQYFPEWKASSDYQKFMNDEITFEEMYYNR